MLPADLTVVDNQGGVVLPGTQGTKTYPIVVSEKPGRTSRRRADTALTTPATIHTEQSVKGSGFNARAVSVIRSEWQKLDSDLGDTGGVVPSCAVTLTINRPVNSGGAVTTAVVKDTIAIVLDVVTRSGQLDKILNMEG